MAQKMYTPGTDNLPPGEYLEIGPRGGKVENARQVTINKGDRLPPTQVKGYKWTPALNTPGTDDLPAGEYLEVGPKGGKIKNAEQVTIEKGDRLPPTKVKGHKWIRIK